MAMVLGVDARASHILGEHSTVKTTSLVQHTLSKTSLDEINMFQGRGVRIRIIKQEEERYGRKKRQEYRITSGGTFSEY